MTTWRGLAIGVTAGAMLWTGTAVAQNVPAGGQKASPERVVGQVVRIDQNSGKVTVQGSGGETFEFQASAETLKDLKVGDRIEAKQRK
jgi:hypothetical protein